jgi:hypothetical protein
MGQIFYEIAEIFYPRWHFPANVTRLGQERRRRNRRGRRPHSESEDTGELAVDAMHLKSEIIVSPSS